MVEKRELLNKQLVRFSERFHLTKRETELWEAIFLFGYSNKELAEAYYITEKTVKCHIANMLQKTNSATTRKLMSKFIREFLI